MPTWNSILEALGLTAQTSDPNISKPSETLAPAVAGSAQASEMTGRRALSKDQGGRDGGVSEGLNLSPQALGEAPLPGTTALSRSRHRAATLQTEASQRGNSKQCGSGPAKEVSVPGCEIAIVANVTVTSAPFLPPQAPPAEPGGSGSPPLMTETLAGGPEPVPVLQPGTSTLQALSLPAPQSSQEAAPSMHDTVDEARVAARNPEAPKFETGGNQTSVHALPRDIPKAEPDKKAIATLQRVELAAVPAALPDPDPSLPDSGSMGNVSVRVAERSGPLSSAQNFNSIQAQGRKAIGLNAAVNASSPEIQYPGIHTAGFDAPPLREGAGVALGGERQAVMPHSAGPGTAETFAALDAQRSAPAPTWIHAGARHAEAGYLDPALGWVAVRADAGASGLHAALLPASGEAAQVLGSHLAGLNAYLSEHHGESATVTMSAPENARDASGMGAGTHPNQGDSARQDEARGREALADRQAPRVSGNSQRGSGAASGPIAAYLPAEGGRYVSVIA